MAGKWVTSTPRWASSNEPNAEQTVGRDDAEDDTASRLKDAARLGKHGKGVPDKAEGRDQHDSADSIVGERERFPHGGGDWNLPPPR